jgi:hypothetical protein
MMVQLQNKEMNCNLLQPVSCLSPTDTWMKQAGGLRDCAMSLPW